MKVGHSGQWHCADEEGEDGLAPLPGYRGLMFTT